jgi:hypothetical protein
VCEWGPTSSDELTIGREVRWAGRLDGLALEITGLAGWAEQVDRKERSGPCMEWAAERKRMEEGGLEQNK